MNASSWPRPARLVLAGASLTFIVSATLAAEAVRPDSTPAARKAAAPARAVRPDFWSAQFNSADTFSNHGIETYRHGTLVSHKLHFKGAAENEVGYTIYLPPGYDSSTTSYPIIYFLHGNHGTEKGLWPVVEKAHQLITAGELPPFIVACMAGGNAFYGNQFEGRCQVYDLFFEEFIPHIEKNYRVKTEPRFRHLQGASAGGYGALMYAVKRPDLFGTVTAIAGAFDGARVNAWSEMYDGKQENFRPFDLALLTAENRSRFAGLRIAQWIGSDDITRRTNEQFHRLFTERAIAHTYHDWNSHPRLQGVTHQLERYYELHGKEILQFHADAFVP